MQKTPMSNLPGVGAMTDTLDFVKNLWGSMGVPGIGMNGIAAPTMSVEDLDKKIADLKAVEAWLNINVSMLRGTIQTLEVQRGTIVTLKSMGAAFANAVQQPGASEKSVLQAAPFASAFFPQGSKPAESTQAAATAASSATAGVDAASAAAAAAMTNPAAWWNMLQEQFKVAVNTAMSADSAGHKPAADAAGGAAEAGGEQKSAAAKGRAGAASGRTKDEGK
jgi:hypothetical protein